MSNNYTSTKNAEINLLKGQIDDTILPFNNVTDLGTADNRFNMIYANAISSDIIIEPAESNVFSYLVMSFEGDGNTQLTSDPETRYLSYRPQTGTLNCSNGNTILDQFIVDSNVIGGQIFSPGFLNVASASGVVINALYALPNNTGSTGQVLVTNGAGGTDWGNGLVSTDVAVTNQDANPDVYYPVMVNNSTSDVYQLANSANFSYTPSTQTLGINNITSQMDMNLNASGDMILSSNNIYLSDLTENNEFSITANPDGTNGKIYGFTTNNVYFTDEATNIFGGVDGATSGKFRVHYPNFDFAINGNYGNPGDVLTSNGVSSGDGNVSWQPPSVVSTGSVDNTTFYIPFANSVSGPILLYGDADEALTYNPFSGVLTATAFDGPIGVVNETSSGQFYLPFIANNTTSDNILYNNTNIGFNTGTNTLSVPIVSVSAVNASGGVGTNGQVLTSNGTGSSWANAPASTTVNTTGATASGNYYLTMTTAQNGTGETLYTDGNASGLNALHYNPANNHLTLGGGHTSIYSNTSGTTTTISTTGTQINLSTSATTGVINLNGPTISNYTLQSLTSIQTNSTYINFILPNILELVAPTSLQLNIAGNSGSSGDILTANGDGTCSWISPTFLAEMKIMKDKIAELETKLNSLFKPITPSADFEVLE